MVAKKVSTYPLFIKFLADKFCRFRTFLDFSKDANTQVDDTWNALSEEEQRAVIKRYQSLKELPSNQSANLQQRMDWFNQLPDAEKQKMREAWQK